MGTRRQEEVAVSLNWQQYLEADLSRAEAVKALFESKEFGEQMLSEMLRSPATRRSALRLLRDLDPTRYPGMCAVLVELASTGHSDIDFVRSLLGTFDASVLDGVLWSSIEANLDDRDDEPFRRYAELLQLLSRTEEMHLLLDRAGASANAHIAEVVDDFG